MENKQQKEINYLDFWAQDENGRYYHICEGTGDNLLGEDIDEGYVDYIYYEIYDSLNSIKDGDEDDGGMVLLKEYYQDMSLAQIVNSVEEMESVKLITIE